MRWLFPKISWKQLLWIGLFTLLGAVIAGIYGIIHDQVTYTISPEYFTRMKFRQFAYANFGLPERVFVGQIGFLATWWVGAFSGWFLARLAIPVWEPVTATRRICHGIGIILGTAAVAGVTGAIYGYLRRGRSDWSGWEDYVFIYDLKDLPAFVQVAYIHNAGYLGGLMGLLMAAAYLLWAKKKLPVAKRGEEPQVPVSRCDF